MTRCENCHSEDIHPVCLEFVTEDCNDTSEPEEPIHGYYCRECTVFVPNDE